MEKLFTTLAVLCVGYSLAEMLLPEGKLRNTARLMLSLIVSCIMVFGFADIIGSLSVKASGSAEPVLTGSESTYEERNGSVLEGLKELIGLGGEGFEADR